MFIGHFAVGMAAKAVKHSLSLGTYFLAAQFVDLLWPTLLLLKVEQVVIEPGITAMTPLNFYPLPLHTQPGNGFGVGCRVDLYWYIFSREM